MSKFLKGLGELLDGAGKITGAVIGGAVNATVTVVDGAITTVGHTLNGDPISAAGSLLSTTGKILGTGVETVGDVFEGTVDMVHGMVMTPKGLRADVNQLAGNLGEKAAGPIGRKIADIITLGSSQSDPDDAPEDEW